MASEIRITTDHDQIRRWVEEHRGKPVSVRGPNPATMPVCCASTSRAGRVTISWDDWFAKFESSSLAVLYQEKKASGEDSRSSSSSLADSTPEATEGTEPLVAVDVFH